MAKIKDCTKGAFLGGNRPHSCKTGGIPTIVKDIDKKILTESGEVVITKPAVEDKTVRTYHGTNKEVLNDMNTEAGGNPIMKKGGNIDDNIWNKSEHELLEDELFVLYATYDDAVENNNKELKEEIQNEIKAIEEKIHKIEREKEYLKNNNIWNMYLLDFLNLKLF